ncbi:MAG: flagellar hook capping protein [Planctomycetes bacterium]|nr:flagellar hook capping protein [Planctomycetota bacterium]
MQVSNISASTAATTAANASNETLGKDAFMKLLVSQLKNQDPLSPADNSEYIAQLAQFSSLEQMQNLNDNIVGLAVLQQNNALMSQLTQSSSLIGQQVRYLDPTTNTSRIGTVGSVKIENDLALLAIDGNSIPLGNVTEVLGHPADGTPTGSNPTNPNS